MVDHPCNMIRLPSTHPLVPQALADVVEGHAKLPLTFKEIGNAAFKKKDYLSALEAYTCGLDFCGSNDHSIRYDLFRNRAIVNINLRRYRVASSEALAAIIPHVDGEKITEQNNVKALFRAGRSFYQLQNFAEAKLPFEKLLLLSPTDADGQKQLAVTQARIKESETGEYDFAMIGQNLTLRNNRLDHASFTKNVKVRITEKRGRGLFATKDIKAGELICVEKAFSFYTPESKSERQVVLNLNGSSVRRTTVNKFFEAVEKAMHDFPQAKRFMDLFDGGDVTIYPPQLVDGLVAVDTFRAIEIMQRNEYYCPATRSADEVDASGEDWSSCSGIWLTASFFNHSCYPNAQHSFIGDLQIARATRDIAKNEEISVSYLEASSHHTQLQLRLKNSWNFDCDCTMCVAENWTSATQQKLRHALIDDVDEFLSQQEPAVAYVSNHAVIKKAMQLYANLDATYDSKTFENVPGVALAHLGFWISTVQCANLGSVMPNVADKAKHVLRDLGYKIEIKAQRLRIDRKNCLAVALAINVADWAAVGCHVQRQTELAQQYFALAKQLWLICYGEMHGFGARYGATVEMLSGNKMRFKSEVPKTLA